MTEKTSTSIKSKEDYPMVLSALHIAEITGFSRNYAYEIMKLKDFPLIQIGARMVVNRDKFFAWLDKQENKVT